jgi:hypothetical protein
MGDSSILPIDPQMQDRPTCLRQRKTCLFNSSSSSFGVINVGEDEDRRSDIVDPAAAFCF